MSSRILPLLPITVAALFTVLCARGQSPQVATEAVWEYRVLTLQPGRCASSEAMTTVLNSHGRQGWELVGFQAGPPQFPSIVEGSVAMRSGAPNGRNDLYPQLADTVQGSVSLNVPQVQPGSCQLIFKRKAGTPHQ